MSKVHQEEIICPKCQTKGEFDLWESMNVDLNPEFIRAPIVAIEQVCHMERCIMT